MRIYNLSLFLREEGTILEALAVCDSLLPGKNTEATLFCSLEVLSLYFCLASVDKVLATKPYFPSPNPSNYLISFYELHWYLL